jgi:hypothetical protein
MNPKYYVTPEEAQRVIDFLNKNSVGGGVRGSDRQERSFLGPFAVPEVAGKIMLLLELQSGAVMNAGLTLDLMSKGYPDWLVASMLQAMAQPEPKSKED